MKVSGMEFLHWKGASFLGPGNSLQELEGFKKQGGGGII